MITGTCSPCNKPLSPDKSKLPSRCVVSSPYPICKQRLTLNREAGHSGAPSSSPPTRTDHRQMKGGRIPR